MAGMGLDPPTAGRWPPSPALWAQRPSSPARDLQLKCFCFDSVHLGAHLPQVVGNKALEVHHHHCHLNVKQKRVRPTTPPRGKAANGLLILLTMSTLR